MKIVLGISASIAAYKAPELVHELTKRGHEVQVIMTEHAKSFVTPLTLKVLSHNEVLSEIMEEQEAEQISHIALAKDCDCFVVAPASANIIGKLANGIADDLLSTFALAVNEDKKRIFAPAMNTTMYCNKAVQRNINQLQEDGFLLIEPRESKLACGDMGKGAMAEISHIISIIEE